MKPRLFVDMDGTLAEWRNIKISIEHIEDCYKQDYFMQKLDEVLYTPHYFGTLKPHQEVIDAIKKIIEEDEIEVYVLSCVLPDKYGQSPLKDKHNWLNRYIPEIDWEHRIFVPNGDDKKKYIPGGVKATDALLDDYTKNLKSFSTAAKAIKLSNEINSRNGTWLGNRISYKSENIVPAIKDIVINDKTVIQDDPDKDYSAMDADEYIRQFEEEDI